MKCTTDVVRRPQDLKSKFREKLRNRSPLMVVKLMPKIIIRVLHAAASRWLIHRLTPISKFGLHRLQVRQGDALANLSHMPVERFNLVIPRSKDSHFCWTKFYPAGFYICISSFIVAHKLKTNAISLISLPISSHRTQQVTKSVIIDYHWQHAHWRSYTMCLWKVAEKVPASNGNFQKYEKRRLLVVCRIHHIAECRNVFRLRNKQDNHMVFRSFVPLLLLLS